MLPTVGQVTFHSANFLRLHQEQSLHGGFQRKVLFIILQILFFKKLFIYNIFQITISLGNWYDAILAEEILPKKTKLFRRRQENRSQASVTPADGSYGRFYPSRRWTAHLFHRFLVRTAYFKISKLEEERLLLTNDFKLTHSFTQMSELFYYVSIFSTSSQKQ